MKMELSNTWFESYTLSSNILEQKDYRIDEEQTILDFLNSDIAEFIEMDEPIMLLSNKGAIFELNVPAALIWECVKEQKNIDSIVQFLNDLFGADINYFQDVYDFICKLVELEFLKNK